MLLLLLLLQEDLLPQEADLLPQEGGQLLLGLGDSHLGGDLWAGVRHQDL